MSVWAGLVESRGGKLVRAYGQIVAAVRVPFGRNRGLNLRAFWHASVGYVMVLRVACPRLWTTVRRQKAPASSRHPRAALRKAEQDIPRCPCVTCLLIPYAPGIGRSTWMVPLIVLAPCLRKSLGQLSYMLYQGKDEQTSVQCPRYKGVKNSMGRQGVAEQAPTRGKACWLGTEEGVDEAAANGPFAQVSPHES